MLWDGLIIITILTLAIAGWNIGIVNSWRGIFGIALATWVTQQFYVDFGTFVVQQLRMSPEYSVAAAYLMLWIATDVFVETLMMVIVQIYKKTKPMFFERLFGAAFGIVKAAIIVLLPAIALQAPITVPPAPPEHGEPLINPVGSGVENSILLPILGQIGKAAYPTLGPLVTSTKPPSYKPVWRHGHEDEDKDN